MAEEPAAQGRIDDLRHGFTIGDVRVDPGSLRLLAENGASVTISAQAMELLLLVAIDQPHTVLRSKLEEALSGDPAGGELRAVAAELETAFANELDRPGYIEVSEHHVRLAPRVELAGRGRFAGLVALWQEIRKRRVFRVATTYALLTFVLLQIADAVMDTLPIGQQFFSILLAVLAIGFPITILVSWFFEMTPQGLFLDRRKTSREMNRSAAVTAMLVLIGIAIGFALAVFRLSDVSEEVAKPAERIALAVLPFDNLGGPAEDQDVADSLVEELLNELAQLSELRVVGRKASFFFRGDSADWNTIVTTLGANMIIEGSIRRIEDRLRIVAQLIDRQGEHVWSDAFEAPIDSPLELLAVQRRIARQVIGVLPITLSQASRNRLASTPTENERAYQLYLQGRNYLRDADQMQRFESAEQLFADALAADPNFVDALSGLCETQALMYQRTERPVDYARAAASCTRLITEDELNAEGYIALGTLNRLSGSFAEAQTLFERALEVSPDSEPAVYGIARAIEGQGDYAGAAPFYERSLQLDPGYWRVYIGYGRYLERGGQFAEAVEQYQRVVTLAPDNVDGYTNLGAAYFDDDRWEPAIDAWQRAIEIYPDPVTYMNLGTAQYYLGDLAAAEQSFRSGIELADDFYPLWGKLGAALRLQERIDEALAAYERAAEHAGAVIAINARNARATYYRASYLAHLGRFEEARVVSARAIELAPDDPAAHYFAAIVASLANDDAAAIDALAEALRRGYSVRIIQTDTYFQPYLNSDRLAEWLPGDA